MKITEPKLTKTAVKIAEKRYLKTDMKGKVIETSGEMFWRVALHLAKAEINWGTNGIVEKTAEKFYERMVNLKFIPGGKALFEAGNPGGTGQLSSCFVLPIEDNIHSIFETLGDAAVVHKNNGGTGFNFSKIRPSGDKVKNVPNAASGPVDFLLAFSAALSKILQGSKRQGANIGILNCDHPDILEFIKVKDEDGTVKNFNLSVGVTNSFMQAVEEDKDWELINPRNGEVTKKLKARKLFDTIARHAWQTGDPGLAFIDRMNEDNPTPILGKIEATNPCITGDALISTENGLIKFQELYQNKLQIKVAVDKRVIDKNGIDLNLAKEVIYQGKKTVYQITTKHGFTLKATSDHKIFTQNGWKQVKDLDSKDEIYLQSGQGHFGKNVKIIFNNKIKGKNGQKYNLNLPLRLTQELGEVVGWLVGDGFIRKYEKDNGLFCLTFGNSNQKEINYFQKILGNWFGSTNFLKPNSRTVQVRKHSIFIYNYFSQLGVSDKKSADKIVPQSIFTGNKGYVIGFLRGLFSSDGTVGFVKNKSAYIRLSSKSLELLKQTQIILLNLGIVAKIYNRSRRKREQIFPDYKNSKGEIIKYDSDGILWELEISKSNVPVFLKQIGFMFEMHQEKIDKLKNKKYYQEKFRDKIELIKKLGEEKVYDLVEPQTHSFIASGMVVHNCGEIPLLPYESCNLCSMVLSSHLKKNKKEEWEIDWDDLEESVKLGVQLLDDMIEVNTYALPEIEQMVKFGNRRIGLGVMGFAHMLYKLGIAYDSQEAVQLSERLSKFIRRKAEEASLELGKIRGVFPNWDRSIYAGSSERYRNCAFCMIAPTGTISMLANCSSGIEPVFSLVTLRKTFFEGDKKNRPTEELMMVDPVFEENIKLKVKNEKLKDEILANIASSNSINETKHLDKKEKKVFVTAHEIDWNWHIKIQAAWQKHFDNSVSKTVNFNNKATVDDVKKAYMMAWRLGCKGITIYRDGSKQDQVLNSSSKNLKKSEIPLHFVSGTIVRNSKFETNSNDQDNNNQKIINTKYDIQNTNSCPECGSALVKNEDCLTCHECGWSQINLKVNNE